MLVRDLLSGRRQDSQAIQPKSTHRISQKSSRIEDGTVGFKKQKILRAQDQDEIDPFLQGRDTLLQPGCQESLSHVHLDTPSQPCHQEGSMRRLRSVFNGLVAQPVQSTRFENLYVISKNRL